MCLPLDTETPLPPAPPPAAVRRLLPPDPSPCPPCSPPALFFQFSASLLSHSPRSCILAILPSLEVHRGIRTTRRFPSHVDIVQLCCVLPVAQCLSSLLNVLVRSSNIRSFVLCFACFYVLTPDSR
ncbi:hypothetical protein C8R45DRAFT_1096654 [Mycena sanguinolenta]|nr:hypothetical protein C8R45DRAFT_1096654 [Mycena sanguinolenta]